MSEKEPLRLPEEPIPPSEIMKKMIDLVSKGVGWPKAIDFTRNAFKENRKKYLSQKENID